MKKIRLLDPNNEYVRKIIQEHKREYAYCDHILYQRCINDFTDVNLYELTEEHIKGPIKVFLINWGMLNRVLGNRKNWEKKLLTVLKKYSNTLEEFRKQKLENVDLPELEEDIKNCYNEIKKIVGPTGASKVLHLICPEFFPMWDEEIRKKISEEYSKRIGSSATGYYKFMSVVQELLQRKKRLWEELSKEFETPKLRIVDIYFWNTANKNSDSHK